MINGDWEKTKKYISDFLKNIYEYWKIIGYNSKFRIVIQNSVNS